MDTKELNDRLLSIGEKIKAKGWKSASIEVGVSYLAMFDREPGPLDPMIYFGPRISATVQHSERNGDFELQTSHYSEGAGWHEVKTLDDALAKLDAIADAMPHMADESARIKAARSKLSEDEKRLLGVR